MKKSSHKAIEELTAAITILAEVVRELDPGRIRQYDEIAGCLERARGFRRNSETFE